MMDVMDMMDVTVMRAKMAILDMMRIKACCMWSKRRKC